MTYRWKRTFAVVGILALAVAVVQAGVKVRADFDKDYDFSKARTFGWDPDGAGEVKLLMREGGDPEQIRARWEPTIKDAVEQQMTKRGLVAAASGTPDLVMHYYFLSGPSSESQFRGQFVGAVPPWGLPDFAMTTTSFKIFEQGTLVLDFVDGPKRQIVWRGVAEAEVDRQRSPVEREKRLREAVGELLKKFPPKTRK
ncbi:MAG TPA: DUF4136 domain-containing protein [Vicinamibacterales bacterium]|nr:DUF4136 domain-containing protein [Vicinamibacterales bacterium]